MLNQVVEDYHGQTIRAIYSLPCSDTLEIAERIEGSSIKWGRYEPKWKVVRYTGLGIKEDGSLNIRKETFFK